MKELENKIALVTGAGRGIGRAISIALAQEGAQLILTGRDISALNETARLITELKSAPVPSVMHMDVLDSQEILQCIDGIDTNLKAPFLVSKAVIPSMIERKSGSIIFIGSITGKRPLINRSVYAASKLGMVGLMRTLALELGRHGIRVNLISPGFVEGPRLDGVIAQVAKNENVSADEMNQQWQEMIPTGKFISPENIAQGVLFFASERSGGTTGEDLNISGGLVMYS
jgi:NAD(P)-dependent dehydrogenase (short-subunit alcohol dehydrogenase family)